MYFKYWVFQRTNPQDESDCCYVSAVDQDTATRLSEQKYSFRTWLHVREIDPTDLPQDAKWIV